MGNNLNKLDIKTVTLSSKTICDLPHLSVSEAGVYCIPCKDCRFKYIGEMSRNINKCLYKHRREIRVGNLNNALLQYISKSNHNFDFGAATMLAYIHNKRLRWIFKASTISLCWSINNQLDFFSISQSLGKLILNSYNIFDL